MDHKEARFPQQFDAPPLEPLDLGVDRSMISHNPEVIWDRVDGTMWLCHLVTGQFFHLNDVAAIIWEACDHSSMETVVDRLRAIYPDVESAKLATSVRDLISSLEEAGLLDVGGD